MKVLVFGGSGFIGSHLKKYLMTQSIKHSSFDLTVDSKKDTQIDVRKPIELSEVPGADVIVNLAAVHKTPGHKDEEYFETNIKGAENICQFARKKNINTIIFTSSIAPYAASEEIKSEASLPMPNTPYGISKLVAEEIHKRWQAEDIHVRKLIILRPGVVFGKNEGGNFTRLYKTLKRGMFVYPGRTDTLKASIYVKDLVRLMMEMTDREQPGVHCFNMCYPQPSTIKMIVNELSRTTGTSNSVPKIPASLLMVIAWTLFGLSKIWPNRLAGIHPDRVRKLMISTNISGEHLFNSGYHLQFELGEALRDWFEDNDRTVLE